MLCLHKSSAASVGFCKRGDQAEDVATYKRRVKFESQKYRRALADTLFGKKVQPFKYPPVFEDQVDGTGVETARRQSVQCQLPNSMIRHICPLLAMPHWMLAVLREIIEVSWI